MQEYQTKVGIYGFIMIMQFSKYFHWFKNFIHLKEFKCIKSWSSHRILCYGSISEIASIQVDPTSSVKLY